MNIGDKVVVTTTNKWDEISFGPAPGDVGTVVPPASWMLPGETAVEFPDGEVYYFQDGEIQPASVETATYAGLVERINDAADYAERITGINPITSEELRKVATFFKLYSAFDKMVNEVFEK